MKISVLAKALVVVAMLNAAAQAQDATSKATIMVIGFVEKPGEYPYDRKLTAGAAIDLAGGMTKRQNAEALRIIITRADAQGRASPCVGTRTTPLEPNDSLSVTDIRPPSRLCDLKLWQPLGPQARN